MTFVLNKATLIAVIGLCGFLLPAEAAKVTTPQLNTPTAEANGNEDETSPSSVNQKDLVITPSKPSAVQKKSVNTELPSFYPYTQSTSLYTGIWVDPGEVKKHITVPLLFGFSHLFPRRNQPQWEVDFAMTNSEKAFVSTGLRQTGYVRSAYRPYGHLHLGIKMDADELLVTFVKYDNLRVRAGLGFEDLLSRRKSFKAGFDFVWGINELAVLLTLGMSWGWNPK